MDSSKSMNLVVLSLSFRSNLGGSMMNGDWNSVRVRKTDPWKLDLLVYNESLVLKMKDPLTNLPRVTRTLTPLMTQFS